MISKPFSTPISKCAMLQRNLTRCYRGTFAASRSPACPHLEQTCRTGKWHEISGSFPRLPAAYTFCSPKLLMNHWKQTRRIPRAVTKKRALRSRKRRRRRKTTNWILALVETGPRTVVENWLDWLGWRDFLTWTPQSGRRGMVNW